MTGSASAPTPRRPLWQRLFGLKRHEGRFVKWRLTRWGMLLAVGFFGLIGMAAFGEYSMQPSFCESCHIMKPYYDAWHSSKHGQRNIPCVDCHFPPGVANTLYGKFQASSQAVKYITNTYGSKPHAEIQDAACMRDGCHEKRLLEGKVEWPITTEDNQKITVHFDHTPHLTLERRGMHLRCISCHSQIVQGQHIEVTKSTCFLCHFKGLKHGRDDQTVGTCKGCHDPPSKPIRLAVGEFDHAAYVGRGVKCENCHSDSVRGDGSVPKQVCWNCHNQPAQIAKYGETALLHDEHITKHKVECSGCHIQIEHSLLAGAEERLPGGRFAVDSGTCGMCHEQTHNGPREMFQGIGGRGVPDMPSPMARARVNCIACHMTKETHAEAADVKGQTFVASQDRCNYCHGDKYSDMLGTWKMAIAAKLDKAEATLLEANNLMAKVKAAGRVSAETQLKAARLLDDADYNVRFVKLAHGVHNVEYAAALLSVAMDRCRDASALLSNQPAAGTP